MMVKEGADGAPGFATEEHPVAKLKRIAHKLRGDLVAGTAFHLESRLIAGLGEQHIIDSIDLAIGEVMIVQKPAQIVDMVPALQLATGNAQKLTGKITGMTMTYSTTVVPQ